MNPNTTSLIFGLLLLALSSSTLGVPVKTRTGKQRRNSGGRFGELRGVREEAGVPRRDALETKLLDVFGLKEVPKHGRKEFETPPFMLELYQNLAAKRKSQHQRKTAMKANTVRSFADTGRGKKSNFEFVLKGLLERETILSAEVHLYKKKDQSSDQETATLNFYRVTETDSVRESTLLETRTIRRTQKGWLVFDVTRSLLPKPRIESPRINRVERGVYRDGGIVAAALENNVVEFAIEVEGSQRDSVLKTFKSSKKHREREPILVVYLNDTAIRQSDIITPVYMGLHDSNQDGGGQELEAAHETRRREKRASSNPRRGGGGKSKTNRCQLYEFYVDFQKVGWSDWIIAPNGYFANFCDGHCPFPLDPHFNATNHATVQAILHTREFSLKGQRIPKPCCVPSDFESIHVLYLDDFNNVVLKEFDDMEAKSCGCH